MNDRDMLALMVWAIVVSAKKVDLIYENNLFLGNCVSIGFHPGNICSLKFLHSVTLCINKSHVTCYRKVPYFGTSGG